MRHLTITTKHKGTRQYHGHMLVRLGRIDQKLLALPDGEDKDYLIEQRASHLDKIAKFTAAAQQ